MFMRLVPVASHSVGTAKAMMRPMRLLRFSCAGMGTYAGSRRLARLRLQRMIKYGMRHRLSPRNMQALWTAGCLGVGGGGVEASVREGQG
jgi:hypothetical protein